MRWMLARQGTMVAEAAARGDGSKGKVERQAGTFLNSADAREYC